MLPPHPSKQNPEYNGTKGPYFVASAPAVVPVPSLPGENHPPNKSAHEQ